MPSTSTDRLYGLTTSVAVKPPCRVATTAAITLSGLQTVGGAVLVEDDRVLVKDQADEIENGIYVVSSTAWTRAPDFDGPRDAVKGTIVLIQSGPDAPAYYELTTDNPVAIGVDELTFIKSLTASAALLSFLQAGTGALARSAQDKMREHVSVADFAGCDPTGATASDAAFISALTYIAGLARAAPSGVTTNLLGNAKILIPAGTYLLTSSASLLNSALFASRTRGLTFEGDGPSGSVVIDYNPAVAGPLMNNNDKVLFLRLKNIVFNGHSATSNLMDTASTGGAQDYVFEDCAFTGAWQYGVNLTGTNTNSEMKFSRCVWSGAWTAFLYSAASGTSDQFLNYWFHHCKYWASSAWIDMSLGGSIKISDTDVSGYTPTAATFLFNLRGNVHARGVTSFSAKGVRFEQKTANAGILYSEWEQGNISFTDCDFGSQAGQSFAATLTSAKFSPGNTAGAHVNFKNCQIMGLHEFDSGTGPRGQGRVTYEDCDFLNFTYPDDAIVFSAAQPGRRPVVRMRNCGGQRNAGGDGVFADADVGWNLSASCTATRKLVSFKNSFGNLPSSADGTFTVVLPLNAIILRAIIDVPSGSNTSTSVTAGYTMQMSDGTALTSIAFTGPDYRAGGSVDTSLIKRCTTRAKATIQLIPNAGNDQTCSGVTGAVALIEYIG